MESRSSLSAHTSHLKSHAVKTALISTYDLLFQESWKWEIMVVEYVFAVGAIIFHCEGGIGKLWNFAAAVKNSTSTGCISLHFLTLIAVTRNIADSSYCIGYRPRSHSLEDQLCGHSKPNVVHCRHPEDVVQQVQSNSVLLRQSLWYHHFRRRYGYSWRRLCQWGAQINSKRGILFFMPIFLRLVYFLSLIPSCLEILCR